MVFTDFIYRTTWAISQEYAQQELSDYLAKIDLIKSGVDIDKTFIKSSEIEVVGKEGSRRFGLFDSIEAEESSYAILNFSGVMRTDGGLCNYGMTDYAKALHSLYANPKIYGVIFNMETGGGEAKSAMVLKSAIDNRNKPVVIHTSILASAGIWSTLSADAIVGKHQMAFLGSIGTVINLSTKDMKEYVENNVQIFAKESKDKQGEFRAAIEGDYSKYQALVDEVNSFFLSDVKNSSRNINTEALTGKMFFAEKALEMGLLDAVGGLDTALSILKQKITNFL